MKTPIEDAWHETPWALQLAHKKELYELARQVFYAGAASSLVLFQEVAQNKDKSLALCVEMELASYASDRVDGKPLVGKN